MDEKPETKPMGQVIQIDQARIRDHLGERFTERSRKRRTRCRTPRQTGCAVPGRYERSEARKDTRAGHYERALETRAGQVRLKVPKLRRQTFETAIIERYLRRESSVEEALIGMHLAGVLCRTPVQALLLGDLRAGHGEAPPSSGAITGSDANDRADVGWRDSAGLRADLRFGGAPKNAVRANRRRNEQNAQ